MSETQKQITFYTDGSCKNNGGGRKNKEGVKIEKTPYGGIGIVIILDPASQTLKPRKSYKKTFNKGIATNNRCELYAVIKAIIIWLRNYTNEYKNCLIKTDSTYVKGIIDGWLSKWKKNGLLTSTGDAVKNIDLVKKLDSLLTKIKQRKLYMSVKHVDAHKKQPQKYTDDTKSKYTYEYIDWFGNYKADLLANLAAKLPTSV